MAPSAAAAVLDAVVAAAADGPTSPWRRRARSGTGGGRPDGAGTRDERDEGLGFPPGARVGTRVDLASSLVASRFSTGKKRKRSGIGIGSDERTSPADGVAVVAGRARRGGGEGGVPGVSPADPRARFRSGEASPRRTLLAARFSGRRGAKQRAAVSKRKSSSGGLARRRRSPRVAALIDDDGDGTRDRDPRGSVVRGRDGEKAEKAEPFSSETGEGVAAKAGVNKHAGAPKSKNGTPETPRPRVPSAAPRRDGPREEEFAAVLADLADETEAHADADAKREAAAAKSAIARPPSSVARAISFEGAWEGRAKDAGERKKKETPAARARCSGAPCLGSRGSGRVRSTPRRTPAPVVPHPRPRRGTQGARRCLCSGWGTEGGRSKRSCREELFAVCTFVFSRLVRRFHGIARSAGISRAAGGFRSTPADARALGTSAGTPRASWTRARARSSG